MSKPKKIQQEVNMQQNVQPSEQDQQRRFVQQSNEVEKSQIQGMPTSMVNPIKDDEQEVVQVEQQPVKRGRGRPRKNPVQPQNTEQPTVKRGRGRPRKNPIPEEQTQTILPGLEEENEVKLCRLVDVLSQHLLEI